MFGKTVKLNEQKNSQHKNTTHHVFLKVKVGYIIRSARYVSDFNSQTNPLNKSDLASQAELARRGALSYHKNIYIFEILAKSCSKNQSPSQIWQSLSKVGTPISI